MYIIYILCFEELLYFVLEIEMEREDHHMAVKHF